MPERLISKAVFFVGSADNHAEFSEEFVHALGNPSHVVVDEDMGTVSILDGEGGGNALEAHGDRYRVGSRKLVRLLRAFNPDADYFNARVDSRNLEASIRAEDCVITGERSRRQETRTERGLQERESSSSPPVLDPTTGYAPAADVDPFADDLDTPDVVYTPDRDLPHRAVWGSHPQVAPDVVYTPDRAEGDNDPATDPTSHSDNPSRIAPLSGRPSAQREQAAPFEAQRPTGRPPKAVAPDGLMNALAYEGYRRDDNVTMRPPDRDALARVRAALAAGERPVLPDMDAWEHDAYWLTRHHPLYAPIEPIYRIDGTTLPLPSSRTPRLTQAGLVLLGQLWRQEWRSVDELAVFFSVPPVCLFDALTALSLIPETYRAPGALTDTPVTLEWMLADCADVRSRRSESRRRLALARAELGLPPVLPSEEWALVFGPLTLAAMEAEHAQGTAESMGSVSEREDGEGLVEMVES